LLRRPTLTALLAALTGALALALTALLAALTGALAPALTALLAALTRVLATLALAALLSLAFLTLLAHCGSFPLECARVVPIRTGVEHPRLCGSAERANTRNEGR
jgi:hypothetical protein